MRTILVLEDNETSRFVIRTVLEDSGFSVVEASGADEAIRACQDHPEIDLLIADAILRDSNGPQIAARLREIRPGVPILFISGFPLKQLINRGLLESETMGPNVAFLEKPFLPKVLLQNVRTLLA
jgi:CheY-like chemotaxis protein